MSVGIEGKRGVRTSISPAGARSARFYRLSHLRRLKECEKVAAICYRMRRNAIEFLLVQTRGGRWTFPKGSAEPGLTHAQAAALEAFEEAGVHGRIEDLSFTRYVRRRRDSRGPASEIAVNAHLCEVTRVESPQEPDRNPTWFSAERAKRHLQEGRKADYSSELCRVVDRAVARILSQPLKALSGAKKDPLQKVVFINQAR